jgi:cell wall-associated NlpC family hydrolase
MNISKLLIIGCCALLMACASEPEYLAPMIQAPQATARGPIVRYALSLQGVPYRYGKDNPEEGFDCSGFVKHVYEHAGVRIPRTVQAMRETLSPVDRSEMRAGDLVFFNLTGDKVSHVGICLNDRQFIHAPSQRTGRVLISDLMSDYWSSHFAEVRRP